MRKEDCGREEEHEGRKRIHCGSDEDDHNDLRTEMRTKTMTTQKYPTLLQELVLRLWFIKP